jgi:hypothetical protein
MLASLDERLGARDGQMPGSPLVQLLLRVSERLDEDAPSLSHPALKVDEALSSPEARFRRFARPDEHVLGLFTFAPQWRPDEPRPAWPEWLRAGGTPEIEVEAREALAIAGGPKAARILSRQLAGGLDAEVVRAGGLIAEGGVDEARVVLDRLCRAARVGLRLTRPWRVVLAGSVNAGKSSLVNALAGHARSLVSPLPGTTRDVLETQLVLAGWSVVLVDTAGLRDAGDPASGATERAGIARALAATGAADLVIRVDDTGAEPPPHDGLDVLSKADALPLHPVPDGVLVTSSRTGAGLGALVAAVMAKLVPEADEPGLLDGAVPFLPRHLEALNRVIAGEPYDGRRLLQ